MAALDDAARALLIPHEEGHMATWGFLIAALILYGFLMMLGDDRNEEESNKERTEPAKLMRDDQKPAK